MPLANWEDGRKQAQANANQARRAFVVLSDTSGNVRVERYGTQASEGQEIFVPQPADKFRYADRAQGYCPVCNEAYNPDDRVVCRTWQTATMPAPAFEYEHAACMVGNKYRLVKPQIDDDDGDERHTPAGLEVEIYGYCPENTDAVFQVGCPVTGGNWFFSLEELQAETCRI